jgi:phosphohistidine phosphatase
MKELLILRHAKSSWDQAWMPDIDRPLNERGKRDAPIMAQKLKDTGKLPQAIICSPAQRTKATAAIFMHSLQMEAEELFIEPNLYESTTLKIDQIVKDLPVRFDRVLLVGHNPVLTDWINRYAQYMIDNLPTCGLAWFSFEINAWQDISFENGKLQHLWFPKML